VLKLRADRYRVLVVDDGSTDRTAEVAAAAGAEVISHSSNSGKTAAVDTAFLRALELGVDALVLIDGDGQHNPNDVRHVAAPVLEDGADMVVGSRFVGIKSAIPRWRVAGQHVLTIATNLGSGLAVSDSQSGFRAFSRRAIEGMRFNRSGFSVESEMQFEAKKLGLVVREVPIHVEYREPAKRNPIRHGATVGEAVLRLIGQHRPLLFFGLPGLLVLLAGLALGLHVVRVYEATQLLAVGYGLITVLLVIVGILAMFVGIMLHSVRGLLRETVQVTRRERS
jgi:glycosyltransferase involved in cell wall biosynthesis